MNQAPQYLAVKFREGDKRTYTYENNGPLLSAGDVVKVPDKSGDGWVRATVVEEVTKPKSFTCKAIIGKVDLPARDLLGDREEPK